MRDRVLMLILRMEELPAPEPSLRSDGSFPDFVPWLPFGLGRFLVSVVLIHSVLPLGLQGDRTTSFGDQHLKKKERAVALSNYTKSLREVPEYPDSLRDFEIHSTCPYSTKSLFG